MYLRAVIEVASGPTETKRFALGSGQSLQLGRTDRADISFPSDGHMSGLHFRLEADDRACYVQDLGSRNGTMLNGQRIANRVPVRSGDEIVAGATHFVVREEEDVPEPMEAPADGLRLRRAGAAVADPMPAAEEPKANGHGNPGPASNAAAASDNEILAALGILPGLGTAADRGAAADRKAVALSDLSPPPPPPRKVPFTAETCPSALTLCSGRMADAPLSDVAVRLSRLYPIHLIIDFTRLGMEPPPELAPPQYLFDWLKPAAIPRISPVLVSPLELPTWPDIVERGSGKDAVVCLYTRLEKDGLLEHLRGSCKGPPGHGNAVLGCCWPNVLGPLLTNSTTGFVGQLLSGIDAVLIESPGRAGSWQIYGNGRILDDLAQVGLVRQTSAE